MEETAKSTSPFSTAGKSGSQPIFLNSTSKPASSAIASTISMSIPTIFPLLSIYSIGAYVASVPTTNFFFASPPPSLPLAGSELSEPPPHPNKTSVRLNTRSPRDQKRENFFIILFSPFSYLYHQNQVTIQL